MPNKHPFDIAAYRYQELDFDDPLEAIKILKTKIEEILKALGNLDWFPNPVTSFYDSPVAEIPTAVGLSKNYIKNFMSQILPKVFKKNEARTAYELEIMTEKSPNMWEKLDIEQRKNLKFEVWIPAKMHMANHDYIRNLKEEEMVDLVNAKVIRMSREFIMHLRYDENGHPVLVDIPTVLASLNESIQRRRGLKETQIDNKEWLILESQELERFALKCEQYIIKTENSFPGTRNKMKVIWRWNI